MIGNAPPRPGTLLLARRVRARSPRRAVSTVVTNS